MTTKFSQAAHVQGAEPQYLWQAGRFQLTWQYGRPLIMGIVNVTPDSFSDGGKHNEAHMAIAHAQHLVEEGADILDLGGESTRPGAQAVDATAEWARLEPVLKEVVKWKIPLSIDTMKTEVMQKAVDLGADILNDVNGFRAAGAEDLAAQSACGLVVMHMQGEPRTMQHTPTYVDVVGEVHGFLQHRLEMLESKGVSAQRMLVDPGFGFGKTLDHNIALMRATTLFADQGAGVLVGVSRKRMIGEICNQPDALQRVAGSVAAALYAAEQGAAVLRVHDVRATVDGLAVACAFSAE
jgi:dihydropteroate synthase